MADRVHYILIACIFYFTHITLVSSSGNVIVRFIRYDNTAGTVTFPNGGTGCCDDASSFPPSCKPNDCDPFIDICASDIRDRCDFLHQRLSPYQNISQIAFYKTEFSFNISFWGGALFFKLDVADVDDHGSEHMGTLRTTHSVLTPALFGSYDWKPVTLTSNGIRVEMEISIQCDKGFRDRNCYCEDKDEDRVEHTMCDRDGNRVCLAGWATRPKCLTSTSPCKINNPCQNNATCGTYESIGKTFNRVTVCTCELDYTGQFCETYIPPPTTTTTTTSTTTTTTTTTTAAPTTATTTTIPHTQTTTTVPPTTTGPLTTTHPTTTNVPTTTATTQKPSTPLADTTKVAATTTTTPQPIRVNQPVVTSTTTSATATKTPTTGDDPNPKAAGSSSGGGGGGGDAGAIGGGVGAVLALVAGLLMFFLLRKKMCKEKDPKVSDIERDGVEDLKDNSDSLADDHTMAEDGANPPQDTPLEGAEEAEQINNGALNF